MIKAIIFDFGNVVCRFDSGIFIRNLSDLTGTPLDELKTSVLNAAGLIAKYEQGGISTLAFYQELTKRCGVAVTIEQFREAFGNIFMPIPSTWELIQNLSRGYRIALLSNTNELHYQQTISRVPVFKYFESTSLSYEVGAMKPAKAIYLDALAKLQLPPADCAYVDDIPEYAQAARALGMHGIHYTSHERLVADLIALGVNTETGY